MKVPERPKKHCALCNTNCMLEDNGTLPYHNKPSEGAWDIRRCEGSLTKRFAEERKEPANPVAGRKRAA